ncbi:uncharacterized protein LOC123470498 [Daphnia magna]|uniref:uncharacterized protein LOC123470498 n=1 Tax=Daphnia magna TaxID=35525 RepID=UPI001E1BA054|nr:uncharacterized protein LOC123470498 [Daphnia magna]
MNLATVTTAENPCSNQGKMTSFLTKKPKEDQPNCFQSLSAISPITIEGLTSTQPEPQSSSSSNSECDEDEESVIEMDTSNFHLSPSNYNKKKKGRLVSVITKKKYRENFVKGWPEFCDWLERRFHGGRDCYVAYCKICNEFKTNGQSELQKHCKMPRHLRFKPLLSENTSLREIMNSFTSSTLGNQVVRMEVKLLLFIAEHDFPLSLMDSLLVVLRSCFPRDPILKQLSMGKQKSSNIIRFGLYNNL